MIFLLVLNLTWCPPSQQLTWYEYYERGEKFFKKGDYPACLNDMDAALAIKPQPGRNQFTRAVQKLDYKPFYYKALAFFKLDDLPHAFEYAQQAYQAEVVANTPSLQADLAPILEAYRVYVQELHLRFTREQKLIEERKHLLELLSQGRLEEARTILGQSVQPEKFEDIELYLRLQEGYQNQLGAFRGDVLERINQWLDRGEAASARALYEAIRDTLPTDIDRAIQQRFDSLPQVSERDPEPSEPTEIVPDEEIDQFKRRLRSVESQKTELDRRVTDMERQNRSLQQQLREKSVEPRPFAPKVFLSLNRQGRFGIVIEAHAVSPLNIKHWLLELNGKALALPLSALKMTGSDFRLDHAIKVEDYGTHRIKMTVTDDMDQQVSADQDISLTRPLYLEKRFWIATGALLMLLLLAREIRRFYRRRQAWLRHFNPYIAGSPVREDLMFYGRDEMMQRIQGLVHKNSFMLHGDRRIGKTSLLWQLKSNLGALESETYAFYPAFIDLQGINEEDLFHHMMAELLLQAHDWDISLQDLTFREENLGYSSRQFSKDMKQLIARLNQASQKHAVVVLLVDEVDVLNEFGAKTNQKLRGIFMKDFADHLTCVMAGIHLKKEWESSGSPWYNFFEEIPLEPIDDKAARALILEPVKGIFKYNKMAVDLLVARAGGHPYLIQKICVGLVGEKLKLKQFHIHEADVEAALNQMENEMKRNQGP